MAMDAANMSDIRRFFIREAVRIVRNVYAIPLLGELTPRLVRWQKNGILVMIHIDDRPRKILSKVEELVDKLPKKFKADKAVRNAFTEALASDPAGALEYARRAYDERRQ